MPRYKRFIVLPGADRVYSQDGEYPIDLQLGMEVGVAFVNDDSLKLPSVRYFQATGICVHHDDSLSVRLECPPALMAEGGALSDEECLEMEQYVRDVHQLLLKTQGWVSEDPRHIPSRIPGRSVHLMDEPFV